MGYDADLLALTVGGFRIFAVSFLFCGVNIFSSSFFTALGDGGVSAAISFLRTLLFQAGALLLLPKDPEPKFILDGDFSVMDKEIPAQRIAGDLDVLHAGSG